MSVKNTVRKQYVRIVDHTAQQLKSIHNPTEGWLATLRKALGMSGSEVAARMKVTRNAVYQAERNERDGAITIKQMQKLAEAMGGRFVYAIVPETNTQEIIHTQARCKAEALIRRASAHMALEKQALTGDQVKQRIEGLTNELMRDMPPDFWQAP